MTALAPAPAGRSARVRLALILGGLTAFAPLSIDMYLPGLPALGHDLSAGASPSSSRSRPARAIVRDTHEGTALVRFFSMLMLVTGLAPILAPVIGGQVLEVTTWRGIFLVLSGIGALLFAAAFYGLRETLPAARRRDDGVRGTMRTMGALLRDRHFVGFALAGALSFGALFTYVAGSPFVLQDLYGASPQAFSAIFAINSIGIISFGQLNGRLAGRVAPMTMLRIGVTAMTVAGCAVFAVVLIGSLPLIALLVPLWVLVANMGLVFPNTTALALLSLLTLRLSVRPAAPH